MAADKYILDACALLALVYKETGDNIVKSILKQATIGNAIIYMNKLNLYEAYYDVIRSKGLQQAEAFYTMVLMSPVQIIDVISDQVFHKGAFLKTQYKMSLADSILLGEASVRGASILTSDHHEFDIIERNNNIKFIWLR